MQFYNSYQHSNRTSSVVHYKELYGAVTALGQTGIRRMLAFSSLSHVGLVVLGIASFSVQGIEGAVFQLLNFTLVSGGLFLLTGFLHQRTGSTEMLSTLPMLANATCTNCSVTPACENT